MNNTLKGYATETWVLKQLSKIKPTTVQQTQNTGAPISEFLSKYFEEVEDPENPGTTMWRAKAAKNADEADKIDGIHINFGYTKSTYKALVDAGLDDPNTLYLIRKG